MKVLVDMNVSPLVAKELKALGHHATHWSEVGEFTASALRAHAADRQANSRRRARTALSLH